MVRVGDEAPELELPDDTGRRVRLADLRGRWVVLYFYPADDTPFCTVEACEFRDHAKAFEEADAVVYGVSRDSVASHSAFRRKHKLPFGLLSDPEGRALKDFDAVALFGHPKRVTYVVDPDGVVAGLYESNVRPKNHVERALAIIEEATGPAPRGVTSP